MYCSREMTETKPPIIIDKALAQANGVVASIYEKYKDDDYMFQKAHYYICNQLPSVLENIKRTHDQNQTRIRELECEQEQFIHTFLNSNKYFYVSTTEKFFYYDGENYLAYNEDDILHHVLSTITKERHLMSWKKSTKVYIMKRIKENNLLKSVPESETIQSVLDAICPLVFRTRNDAKYFLTILGDNIFRKNGDVVYLFSPKSKQFIRELTNISQMLLGANCGSTIKHKYYEHDYYQCRLFRINDSIQTEAVWNPLLVNNALNILCVACHYSVRYGNADNYLETHCNDENMITHTLFLKNHSKDELVSQFAAEYLHKCEMRTQELATISWKNMQYLWKHFLDSKRLPSIMFQQTLKSLLIGAFENEYVCEADAFCGLTSKYLPQIQRFIAFWEETISLDGTSHNMEYEIEELCLLFKNWQERKEKGGYVFIGDTQMLDLIGFYFSGIDVEENKYIYGIKCALWDKQQDIYAAMELLKENIRTDYSSASGHRTLPIVSSYGSLGSMVSPPSPKNDRPNISLYDAYVWYCKYYSQNGDKHPLVSKNYFEKYMFETAGEHILNGHFIDVEWALE